MLFRTAHNIDAHAVEAKIKAKEIENSRVACNRGDIPEAVHAYEDGYSMVSSFSDDTAFIEPWRKRSNNLLDYFANNSRTDFYTRHVRPAPVTEDLFEA